MDPSGRGHYSADPLPTAGTVCPSHDVESRFLCSLSGDIPKVLGNSKVNHRDNQVGSVRFSCLRGLENPGGSLSTRGSSVKTTGLACAAGEEGSAAGSCLSQLPCCSQTILDSTLKSLTVSDLSSTMSFYRVATGEKNDTVKNVACW